jgi:hypothetical protein
VWRRMAAKNVKLDRARFDSASAVVDRLIGYEVSRFAFGPEPEFRREARNDRVINTALELSASAATQRDLLQRAAERRAAKREDVPHKS